MAFVRYTALRVLVFVVATALLWIIGLRGYMLLLVALLASGAISLFALNRSRDALSAAMVNRHRRIKGRMAERRAAEDAWNDEVRRSAEGSQGDRTGE